MKKKLESLCAVAWRGLFSILHSGLGGCCACMSRRKVLSEARQQQLFAAIKDRLGIDRSGYGHRIRLECLKNRFLSCMGDYRDFSIINRRESIKAHLITVTSNKSHHMEKSRAEIVSLERSAPEFGKHVHNPHVYGISPLIASNINPNISLLRHGTNTLQ
jgi:hypothetical protein